MVRLKSFSTQLTKNLGSLVEAEFFADVVIHCRGQVKVRTSKLILSQVSNFFKAIFEAKCECACNSSTIYNLICPDFDPEPVKLVRDLICMGQALVHSEDDYKLIKIILKEFQINIDLTNQIELATLRNQFYKAFCSCKSYSQI